MAHGGEGDIHNPESPDYFPGTIFDNRCVACIAYKGIYCMRQDDFGNPFATCEPTAEYCFEEVDGEYKLLKNKMFFVECFNEAKDTYDFHTLTTDMSHNNVETISI